MHIVPNPKDPERLAEYRETMRRIALERGYGKWMTGKKMSPESIAKTRAANLGKTISPEHRAALGAARQRDIATGKQLFGGAEGRARARATTSEARRGRTFAEFYGSERGEDIARRCRETNRARWPERKADKHPRHNASFEYDEWRRAVFVRDDFTCQRCGTRGVRLHAHHVQAWKDSPDLRYEVSNGLTLCPPCHRAEHRRVAA
jgi:HNH endonuclease